MDPHYWPSLYPGIIVGLLVGFATGGWIPLIAGGIGGLAGAAAGLELIESLGLGDDFFSFAVPVLCAAAGAKGLIVVIDVLKSWINKPKI